MHRVLLERMEASAVPLALSHFPSGRGSLVVAFSSRSRNPEWIAKISRRPSAIERTRKEYENLRYLEPWAAPLGIPVPLAWEARSESACLVMTGAKGMPEFPQLRIDSGGVDPASLFDLPFAWLDSFQKLVPLPPGAASLEEVTAGCVRELAACPATSATVDALQAALSACASDGWPPSVVVHGDFASCNILRAGKRTSVIDWESFGAGAPFQDVFTFVCTIPCYQGAHCCTPLEHYKHVLFSDSAICDYVRRCIAGHGTQPKDVRLAFYAFLAAHLRFQAALPDQDWLELFGYLGRHGYPAPCTRLED